MEDEEYTQTFAEEEEEEAIKLFKMLDLDNNSFITLTEYRPKSHEFFVPDNEDGDGEWLFKILDLDNNGFITLVEYDQHLHEYSEEGYEASDEDYEIFLDADMDGDGQVSYEELLKYRTFRDADEDDDGQVSYEEFLKLHRALA